MSKKAKILLACVILAVLLILYFIFNSKPLAVNQPADNQKKVEKESVNLIKMEDEYKKESKVIFSDYENLSGSKNITESQIEQAKGKLLELKVPTKFKDLHINLVFAMVKMENFLKSGDNKEKASSQQMINQIKANYVWLN